MEWTGFQDGSMALRTIAGEMLEVCRDAEENPIPPEQYEEQAKAAKKPWLCKILSLRSSLSLSPLVRIANILDGQI